MACNIVASTQRNQPSRTHGYAPRPRTKPYGCVVGDRDARLFDKLDNLLAMTLVQRRILVSETMNSRILLIDDDVQLGALLQELFTSKGYAMELAYDGEEGASKATQGAHDLVILDVMLPKKDGLAVLSEIRQSSDIPVLMLTAKGEHSDRIKGLERGADDYLAKPFNPRELLLRVGAILRRGSWKDSTEQDTLTVGPLELRIRQLEASVGHRLITLTGPKKGCLRNSCAIPARFSPGNR